jgi:hypothetical protein
MGVGDEVLIPCGRSQGALERAEERKGLVNGEERRRMILLSKNPRSQRRVQKSEVV